MIPAVLCWSSGKDSALCLKRVFDQKKLDVKYLLTTISSPANRISMHGINESLLDEQVKAIGIPLIKVYNDSDTNVSYENNMKESLLKLKNEGINNVIFGDIFLEDLRAYRETMLAKVDMKAHFPLWNENTSELVSELEEFNFKSKICCINDEMLPRECLGNDVSSSLIGKYKNRIDPCGENGEYHSFCYDAPYFQSPINISVGEKVTRTYPSLEEKGNEVSFTFIELETI